MTDRMADVSSRRWLPTFLGPIFRRSDQRHLAISVQLANIQADVSHQHCQSSFLTLRPMSDADVGLSVGKLDIQFRRPTLADTGQHSVCCPSVCICH